MELPLSEKLRVWMGIYWGLLKSPSAFSLSFEEFHFLSDKETLLYLKEKGVGIVRFGNAELAYMAGCSVRRQKQEPDLQKRLVKILSEYNENKKFLVALPLDLILGKEYEKRGALPDRWRIATYAALPLLKRERIYASPFCFRLRMRNIADKERKDYTPLLRSLFEGKDIIYIGHEENIADIQNLITPTEVIPIPSKHAFAYYEELLKKTMEVARRVTHPLVLITAGVMATALSAELNSKGILAYDIGNIYRRIIKT